MDCSPLITTKELFTTKETCELLSMSRDRLQTCVNHDLIVPVRIGQWLRFSRVEIARFVTNLHRSARHLSPLPVATELADYLPQGTEQEGAS